MAKLYANSGDPDQAPHSAASDPGLHLLANYLLGIPRFKWVKQETFISTIKGALHSFDLHFYLFTALTYIKCNHSKYNSTCPLGTVSINCKHTK